MAPQKSKVIPVEVFGRRVEDQLELRTRNFAGTRSRYLFSLLVTALRNITTLADSIT